MSELVSNLIAQGVAVAGFAISYLSYRIVTKEKREKKIADHALLVDTVARIDLRFKKEFDGNSDGSRQAINSIAKTQDKEVEKSAVIAAIVHRLEGSFEEHRIAHERAG